MSRFVPNPITEATHDLPCRWDPTHKMLRVRRPMRRYVRCYDVCNVCAKMSAGWNERLSAATGNDG